MKYYIKIRTPDDIDRKNGWTARAEGVEGTPYFYTSNGFSVELSWERDPKVVFDPPFIQFNPVPKPSSTKKVRGKKTIDPVSNE